MNSEAFNYSLFSLNTCGKAIYLLGCVQLFTSCCDEFCEFIEILLLDMKPKLNALFQFRFLFSATQNFNLFFSNAPPFETVISNPRFHGTAAFPATENFDEKIETIANREKPTQAGDVLRRWGCTEKDVSLIFFRHPSLCKMDANSLQSKLQILSNLGVSPSDLAKMIQCRPRFLNCRLAEDLDERIEYLQNLFGLRNPSLLNYDLRDKIKLVVAVFDKVGVSRDDFIPILLSRPTLIPRCILNDEKMDYIRRTGVSKDCRMYKHVVAIFSVSRVETIREKIANLEQFGFSEDEILSLSGRNPLTLTFSSDTAFAIQDFSTDADTDTSSNSEEDVPIYTLKVQILNEGSSFVPPHVEIKIQRNMTFILGIMKLSARTVLSHPCLLCSNLETLLKPRFFLAQKIDDMGLAP